MFYSISAMSVSLDATRFCTLHLYVLIKTHGFERIHDHKTKNDCTLRNLNEIALVSCLCYSRASKDKYTTLFWMTDLQKSKKKQSHITLNSQPLNSSAIPLTASSSFHCSSLPWHLKGFWEIREFLITTKPLCARTHQNCAHINIVHLTHTSVLLSGKIPGETLERINRLIRIWADNKTKPNLEHSYTNNMRQLS